MAREVQFTTLPDLFFSIHPIDEDSVDAAVDSDEFRKAFNRKVREVLKRKLRTYLVWKRQTQRELLDKRGFTLRYMHQHVHIIKLYMTYVKPYLKNIQRLELDAEKNESPDLVAAFEGSVIEVEFMGQFLPMGNKKYWNVLSIHFLFRTKPSLNYNAEGYNRGPIHEGQVNITYRTYAWTQKEIDAYKRMRSKEDFLLLKIIDKNLDYAMGALGDDFFRYLDEAEEMMKDKYKDSEYVPFRDLMGMGKEKSDSDEKEKKKKKSSNNPFAALAGGFQDLGNMFSSKPKNDKKKKKGGDGEIKLDSVKKASEIKSAQADSGQKSWLAYKNYKKGHNMIAW